MEKNGIGILAAVIKEAKDKKKSQLKEEVESNKSSKKMEMCKKIFNKLKAAIKNDDEVAGAELIRDLFGSDIEVSDESEDE